MIRRFLAAVLVALAGLQAACADEPPAQVSPDEARRMAIVLLQSGQNTAALAMAQALLVRDPTDIQALVVKSRAARNLGQFDVALEAARSAWRVADDDNGRFSAAMVMAQALSSEGKRTQAQVWLRRAVDAAPDEVTRERAVRDFRYVRQRNPWAFEFSFNISPSDNINNGSLRERTSLFGLPFEFELSGAARALSGTEVSGGVAARYRFSESARQAHDLILQLDHRTYVLSDSAKAQAPGVRGSDFAFTNLSAGYVYRAIPETWLGPYTLNATVGQSWYGGDDYYAYLRLGATQDIDLDKMSRLTFSGSAERQFGARAADADILRGDVSLRRGVGGLGALRFSVGATASASTTDIAEYSEFRTGVDFALARPILGAQLKFGLQWRQRDYPRSRYNAANGRDDETISASIDMVFKNIDRYGFNPTLSVVGSRTESNIGLFDSKELGVRFGIRSAF